MMFLIKSVSVETGNTITFKTKHLYDHNDRTGTLVGFVHYDMAKTYFTEIPDYYQNLNFELIPNAVPFNQLTYVVIKTSDGKFFAAAEEWIADGTFKKISNKYKDIRIIGIEDGDELNILLQDIRNRGYAVEIK